MTPADDVARFRALAVEYGQAGEQGNPKRSNRAFRALIRLRGSMWKKDPDSCRALLPLLDDEDAGVRTWAAFNALDFSREGALRALQEVAQGAGEMAFDARYFIKDIEADKFVMEPAWRGE